MVVITETKTSICYEPGPSLNNLLQVLTLHLHEIPNEVGKNYTDFRNEASQEHDVCYETHPNLGNRAEIQRGHLPESPCP